MRVLLLTGKGGVGKTSLAAATALAAVDRGQRVFLLSTDPAHSLGDALGCPVGPEPRAIARGLVAREVQALRELERTWSAIRGWLRALLREQADDVVAEELLVFPGLEELVALRAVREVEAMGEFDLCVVDCAPTGATLRMLRFPEMLALFMEKLFELQRRGARWLRPVAERAGARGLVPDEEFFDAFERLYRDVDDVRQILLDGDRTTARLVTEAARVVVDETRRAFAYLNLFGIATDAVIVNRLLPRTARAGYFARWGERQAEELAAIEAAFPVPVLYATLRDREVVGPEALRALAAEVYGERDPAACFVERRPLRFRRRGGHPLVEVELPGVSKEEVRIAVRGSELRLRVRGAERVLALPDSIAGRSVLDARLHAGVLEIRFAR